MSAVHATTNASRNTDTADVTLMIVAQTLFLPSVDMTVCLCELVVQEFLELQVEADSVNNGDRIAGYSSRGYPAFFPNGLLVYTRLNMDREILGSSHESRQVVCVGAQNSGLLLGVLYIIMIIIYSTPNKNIFFVSR